MKYMQRLMVSLFISFFSIAPCWAQLTMKEQWRLDPDVDDVPIWTASRFSIDADKEGNLYLADFVENRILVFNNKGELAKQIGRAGDGPGEFRRLAGIDVLDDGSFILLGDYGFDRKLIKLDASGKEIESDWVVSKPHPYGAWRYRRDGAYRAAQVWKIYDRSKVKEKFGPEAHRASYVCPSILPADSGEAKLELNCSLRLYSKRSIPESDNLPFYMENATVRFAINMAAMIAQWSDDLSLYTALPTMYEIHKYDAELKKVTTYSRENPPIYQRRKQHTPQYYQVLMEDSRLGRLSDILDEDFAREAVLGAKLPEKLPPVLGLIPVDNALLVLRGYDTEKDQAIADFWDAQGTFQGEIRLPKMFVNLTGDGLKLKRNTVFRNGYAFIMEPKGTEYVLVCYRYQFE